MLKGKPGEALSLRSMDQHLCAWYFKARMLTCSSQCPLRSLDDYLSSCCLMLPVQRHYKAQKNYFSFKVIICSSGRKKKKIFQKKSEVARKDCCEKSNRNMVSLEVFLFSPGDPQIPRWMVFWWGNYILNRSANSAKQFQVQGSQMSLCTNRFECICLPSEELNKKAS